MGTWRASHAVPSSVQGLGAKANGSRDSHTEACSPWTQSPSEQYLQNPLADHAAGPVAPWHRGEEKVLSAGLLLPKSVR